MSSRIKQGEGKSTIQLTAPEKPQSTKQIAANEKAVPENYNDEQHLTSWSLGLVIASVYLGVFLVAIDTTIISVAVPKNSTAFKALNDVGWYGSAYLMTVTAFQSIFGKVYRYFDVKTVYLSSIVIFEGMR